MNRETIILDDIRTLEVPNYGEIHWCEHEGKRYVSRRDCFELCGLSRKSTNIRYRVPEDEVSVIGEFPTGIPPVYIGAASVKKLEASIKRTALLRRIKYVCQYILIRIFNEVSPDTENAPLFEEPQPTANATSNVEDQIADKVYRKVWNRLVEAINSAQS